MEERDLEGLSLPGGVGKKVTEGIDKLIEVKNQIQAIKKLGKIGVNEDVKVVADIMSKSFEFGEKMIETVEFASKAKKTGENITIFKCGAGCNQTFQDSNGVITPSNKTPTETRQNHPE